MQGIDFSLSSHLSFSLEAPSWPADRQAGTVCEFSEADVWCQDLHLKPSVHPERPDLPHRRSVAAAALCWVFLPEV